MKYNVVEKVSKEFEKWIRYCEKERLASIGSDLNNPENYTNGAGDNNFTIFAKIYKEKTGIDVQGQPWCDSFIDTIFIHLFGVEMTKKMLGGFSAYTPTSANMFKKIKRWTAGTPEEGYIGFFENDTRIYHTFYVIDYDKGLMTTVEGNTSGLSGIVENGGCVAKKTYAYGIYKARIPGFGMPDYSLVEEYVEDWMQAADGQRWWYQYNDGSYAKGGWIWIDKNQAWYLFDDAGYMLTGYQVAPDGRKHLLLPEKGADEGKCMVTNDQGALYIVEYDWKEKRYKV